jgi:hypothetical protein|mmetsp:Transcript_27332/g.74003  ORF Transcript_27332/g.74003 Transcript_27332/m.74003 type:complete len:271 (+) Transcript_27332:1532-2344(+)
MPAARSTAGAIVMGGGVYTALLTFLPSPPSTGFALGLVLLSMYMPFYFDGRPLRHDAYNKSIVCWPYWAWFWVNLLGLPQGRVELDEKAAESFKDPKAQRIYSSHPHGVGSLHHMGLMLTPPVCQEGHSFEKISPGATRRDLAASVLFRIPILRELALAAGGVDASRSVVERMLRKGLSIGVLTGGEQEQILSAKGEHTVYIMKRKGIMKLALKHGVPIVPCYCFGETDLYDQSKVALGLRKQVRQCLISRRLCLPCSALPCFSPTPRAP